MIGYRVTHTTCYQYSETVHGSLNELRIQPRRMAGQSIQQFAMEIEPHPRYRSNSVDTYGNHVTVVDIDQSHLRLQVKVVSEVKREPGIVDPGSSSEISIAELPAFLQRQTTRMALEARCMTQVSPLIPMWVNGFRDLEELDPRALTVSQFGLSLCQLIYHRFEYRPGHTEISTPLDVVVRDRAGVCQDFAHLAIACARRRGIPARYISGYLETTPPPGTERLIGVDATHAWFALFDPVHGWIEFDPTNNRIPDERYITIAWGRDYSDVTPIRGVVRGGGAGHTLWVAVDVDRLN